MSSTIAETIDNEELFLCDLRLQTRVDFEVRTVRQDCYTMLRQKLLNFNNQTSASEMEDDEILHTGLSYPTNESLTSSTPSARSNNATVTIDPYYADKVVKYSNSIIASDKLEVLNVLGAAGVASKDTLSELFQKGQALRKFIVEEQNRMAVQYANLKGSIAAASNEKKYAETALAMALAARIARGKRSNPPGSTDAINQGHVSHANIPKHTENSWKSYTPMTPVKQTPELPCEIVTSRLTPLRDTSNLSNALALVVLSSDHSLLTPPVTPNYSLASTPSRDLENLSAIQLTTVDHIPSAQNNSTGNISDDFDTVNNGILQIHDAQLFHVPSREINASLPASPISPYTRPPMSLEDMQKCIRCLLGKDKSLKTGNRARAFLGVSWSQIVSFDPDTLLQRGVVGIKAGSTGMASRLRMMTIIESALANRNDNSIPTEVWEQPTSFCERCQQLYPITVPSNMPVPTPEEYEALKARWAPAGSPAANAIQSGDPANAKCKRNRHKPRAARGETFLGTPTRRLSSKLRLA